MKTTTLFSWGYYGWGNATAKLVEAVDAIEKQRGFLPPIFVDIRIRRTVQAVGFKGSAFESLLGEDRYRWMRELGNKRIVTKTGARIQIAKPAAANDLLDLALKASKTKRRVIFFCSCCWPKTEGKISCHRTTVANLVLAAAKRHGVSVQVVEWPGDKARRLKFELRPALFQSVSKGLRYIPLGKEAVTDYLQGPPWGSIATFHCGSEKIHRIVGPLMWRKKGWQLQVLNFFYDPDVSLSTYLEEATRSVKSCGLDPSWSLG